MNLTYRQWRGFMEDRNVRKDSVKVKETKQILHTCSRCGEPLTDYTRFRITAFYKNEEDGAFYYCGQCYHFMTEFLNKNTKMLAKYYK